MKKWISFLLLIVLCLAAFPSCGDAGNNDADAVKISFKGANSFDYLKSIDGQMVTINGYMATSSPVDGSYYYLMNLPYQSCPFCKPNTNELSNTMMVIPKTQKSLSNIPAQAIRVTGKLVVAPSADKPFTDAHGLYQYAFYIKDATYKIIKDSDLSEEYAKFQQLSAANITGTNTSIVNEIYNMYNYLDFVCRWPNYYVTKKDDNNELDIDFYLWPADISRYLEGTTAQFGYGYQDGYFDKIISSIERVDKEAFADLIQNIKEAKALAERAISDWKTGKYSSEKDATRTYTLNGIQKTKTFDYIYTLDNGTELENTLSDLYTQFSDWLAKWDF